MALRLNRINRKPSSAPVVAIGKAAAQARRWEAAAANRASLISEAEQASNEAAAELNSYGIPAEGGIRIINSKVGGATPVRNTTDEQLQEGRNTALRVSQREQLRAQNQELKMLDLQGKRRRRGRGSLLSYVSSKKDTLGPSGTLQ